MKRTTLKRLVVVACLAVAQNVRAATLQPLAPHQIPKSWSYDVDKRGNRVDRDNRVVKPDGSWREEIRQGNCITLKERSATGEYRETRQCSAPHPK